MPTIAVVEIISAVFLGILFITQMVERSKSKSSKLLTLCILLVLLTLIVDAMAYIFMDDSTPFWFRYLVCLFAYMGEGICFLGFAFYSEAFFKERTKINPWIFRILKIVEVIWIIATAVAFIAGKMVVFENGVEVHDNGYPLYLSIYQIIVMLYTPAIAIYYRKKIGGDAVVLLSFFNIAPIVGIIASIINYYDYSYFLGTIALIFIAEFPQRRKMRQQQQEQVAYEALKGNYERIFALEDTFESLYDVELESGNYDVFVKGDFYKNIVLDNLHVQNNYFDDLRENIESVVYEEDREGLYKAQSIESIIQELSKNEHFDYYYRLVTEKGPVWFKTRTVYKDAKKKNIIIGVFNAEKEMESRQLEIARDAAQAADKAKTEFLFNMSHDIRTPMNAITGFTTIAKKYVNDPEKMADYLEKIDTSGQQLLTLINKVLEMARIESGQVEIEEKPVNIQQRYKAMTTVFAEQAELYGLKFNPEIKDLTHYNIYADESKVSSITLNIVNNAMKYTPEGGQIDFLVEEVEARKPGFVTLVFTVSDTGIGMSEDYQKTLFEPFSREKNTTVSKIQGTGLGMSIVKRFVDLLGGEIEVQSKLGEGTKFSVTLDFRINEEADSSEEKNEDYHSISFKGRKVLLVEDNELNREIALDILEDEELNVEEAVDGAQAVSMVKEKGPDYYDFILMDIQMPVMNGYEATKEIREMYPDKNIPIIALSANAFEEDRIASKNAGMNGHIAKPINITELFGVLAKYL